MSEDYPHPLVDSTDPDDIGFEIKYQQPDPANLAAQAEEAQARMAKWTELKNFIRQKSIDTGYPVAVVGESDLTGGPLGETKEELEKRGVGEFRADGRTFAFDVPDRIVAEGDTEPIHTHRVSGTILHEGNRSGRTDTVWIEERDENSRLVRMSSMFPSEHSLVDFELRDGKIVNTGQRGAAEIDERLTQYQTPEPIQQ